MLCWRSKSKVILLQNYYAGMYTGYNALNMALAMPESGRVIACEIESTYIDIAKPFFKEVRTVQDTCTTPQFGILQVK